MVSVVIPTSTYPGTENIAKPCSNDIKFQYVLVVFTRLNCFGSIILVSGFPLAGKISEGSVGDLFFWEVWEFARIILFISIHSTSLIQSSLVFESQ